MTGFAEKRLQLRLQPKWPSVRQESKMRQVFVMANTRFFLDERKATNGKPGVLKVAIAHKRRTALISLDARIFPNQWDKKKQRVVNHHDRLQMNVYITTVKQQIDSSLLTLANEGRLDAMTISDIKSFIDDKLHPERAEEREKAKLQASSLLARFLRYADSRQPSTRGVYMQTYRRLLAFEGNHLERLRFEDISNDWLTRFDNFMAKTAPSKNARNIHLRNLRTVFNDAIDDGITTWYPFRRFPIRAVPTKKRSMKVDELRTLFNFEAEPFMQYYIDIFKLIFMLIGINMVDLCRLKQIDEDGRIYFNRAKTKRPYSIKVEPEALEIIERHHGNDWLIDVLDHYTNHNDFTRRMDRNLKKIGPMKRVGRGGKKVYTPLFPKLTTYWARHTWATIAAVELDIPKDVISHALGHGNNTVTDIYIDFDQRKVDEANRRVLDYVLYGKK